MEHELIKRFAIDTLGCGCDSSVFDSIDYNRHFRLPSGLTLSSRILIGGRLLIYTIDGENISPADLNSIVRDGIEERNSGGYNRLRVVITSGDVEADSAAFTKAFSGITVKDEKTHLHVIDRKESI